MCRLHRASRALKVQHTIKSYLGGRPGRWPPRTSAPASTSRAPFGPRSGASPTRRRSRPPTSGPRSGPGRGAATSRRPAAPPAGDSEQSGTAGALRGRRWCDRSVPVRACRESDIVFPAVREAWAQREQRSPRCAGPGRVRTRLPLARPPPASASRSSPCWRCWSAVRSSHPRPWRRPPLQVTTTTLPPGNVTTPYAVALTATGGELPWTWSIASGSLPNGLTVDLGGIVSGKPDRGRHLLVHGPGDRRSRRDRDAGRGRSRSTRS